MYLDVCFGVGLRVCVKVMFCCLFLLFFVVFLGGRGLWGVHSFLFLLKNICFNVKGSGTVFFLFFFPSLQTIFTQYCYCFLEIFLSGSLCF